MICVNLVSDSEAINTLSVSVNECVRTLKGQHKVMSEKRKGRV